MVIENLNDKGFEVVKTLDRWDCLPRNGNLKEIDYSRVCSVHKDSYVVIDYLAVLR